LYSYKYFKENFEQNIVEGTKEEQNSLERLHKMIAPFLLRRLKKDVLKDLPDKIEKVVYTKLGKEQDQLYKATEKNIVMNLKKKSGKEFQKNKVQILAELTKLRQICCEPSLLYDNYKSDSAKLDTCMEVLENALEGGHKVLLFSQFTTMLEVLAACLKSKNISYFMLTGSTSKARRRELVERFQEGRAEVFLISLKAGGTGLNLTAADMVIHYDPWWNVAAQNQATDRTHRIGQKNDVTVVKLIAKGTIEERILALQEKKQDLADKIISAEGTSLSALTKEDLLDLFGEKIS
jgi:SNF2 family DNA or RNA helicase